jgi:iron(III) transport system ATP-binding protein
MSTAISIKGLKKTFPAHGGGTTTAVDSVQLQIEPGELFFLLGPSGCGKTTLLRMIAGFIEPTSGTLLFNGKDVTFAAPNDRNTGMVFQSYALWPHMTVAGNVAFGLEIRKIKDPEKSRRVNEALAAVRMEQYAQRRPNQLSGGQQQRVALARALVIRPDVLLLDEPLSNLDAKLRIELRSEIRRICKESGITTIYVTHDQKEALSMADRIAIMESGRVVQIGGPAELYRKPANRFVAEFLGETNLIPATVAGTAGSQIELKTGAGTLHALTAAGSSGTGMSPASAASPSSPAAGTQVLLSIRPESLRLAPIGAPNSLPATLVDSMYLGEMVQHTVELSGTGKDHARIKLAQLNPPYVADNAMAAGKQVAIAVDPADVVVLTP